MVADWIKQAMATEEKPEALYSVTGEILIEGIRMKYSKCYSVQIMLPAEIRHLAFILCSHLSSRAESLEHRGRRIYVDIQQEPSHQRLKDNYLALRSWLREVIGGDVHAQHGDQGGSSHILIGKGRSMEGSEMANRMSLRQQQANPAVIWKSFRRSWQSFSLDHQLGYRDLGPSIGFCFQSWPDPDP